ncbi:MAG: SsrA-binding protein SmpB [Christensenellaceae bacterium]|jgi:SsrA-binding protein|nr:SsrA-binding protein SmpB [Christensenellaceae bacterium]
MAEAVKQLAQNRKAWHDYFIEESFEAGIELSGTEVKSIRMGRLNLRDSFVTAQNGQAVLHGLHISPYEQGNIFNKDPLRPRRLLLHKAEIRRMGAEAQRQGYAIVPLRVYLKHGLVKLEIALAKGKKLYDKREAMAEKDAQREIERNWKSSR